MIYRREEFVQEDEKSEQFPLKQIEQLTSLDGQTKKFLGHVSLGVQTPMGVSTLPLTFEIESATVEEAFSGFDARAQKELEKARSELQQQLGEMRRQSQSRIITPGELPQADIGKLKLR